MRRAVVREVLDGAAGITWLAVWLAGCVLAKGFWSTTFAVLTGGLWSAYLVAERAMRALGWA